MTKTVKIYYGAIGDSIVEQLKMQKLKFDKKKVDHFESHKKAILLLRINGYLPEKAFGNLLSRLHKNIVIHVTKMNTAKSKKFIKNTK